MSIALAADHLDSAHSVARVIARRDRLARDGGGIAGPPGTRIELRVRIEEGGSTANATIDTGLVEVVIATGERALRTALASNLVLLVTQDFLPLFFGFLHLVGHC